MIRPACVPLLALLAGCSLFQGTPPVDARHAGLQAGGSWPALPEPGPVPDWRLPEAVRFRLSNGVPVTYVRQGSVPLFRMEINVYTGSAADPPGKGGLAAFTADMMNEGTESRDAIRLSDDLLAIASNVAFGAGLDHSYASVDCLEDRLDETLALAADMLLHPTFPEQDVERVRQDRLNWLLSERDRLPSVGWNVFARVVYGYAYLGRPTEGDDASVRALAREDMVSWYRRVWTADNAGIVAAGRLEPAQVAVLLERHLGRWEPGIPEERPVAPPVQTPTRSGLALYWVDRPGASQSYVVVGGAAPALDPDLQDARDLSNDVLGGTFGSRLNMNLREDKGYTYGARSSVVGRRQGGLFLARASVKAEATAASLVEFLAEIRGIVDERPITQEELDEVASRSVAGFPSAFEGLGGVVGFFAWADANRLPDGWLGDHRQRILAVSLERARQELSAIVDPRNLAIVIVGDHDKKIDLGMDARDGRPRDVAVTVGGQVEALGLAPIVMLDDNGAPVPAREEGP